MPTHPTSVVSSCAESVASGSVAIVIANWNRADDLRECLESLARQNYRGGPIEVVVVDNGSQDDSVVMARGFAACNLAVRVEAFERNRGFAAATNHGIRESSSEFVALLNNDAVVDPSWLAAMVEAFESDPVVGSCTSKVLSYSDPEIIDNVGHVLFRDGLTRGRGRGEKDVGQYESREEVFCASGCACLFRRSTLQDVGLLDEDFFAYCEDADLGFRARLRGWKTLYVPTAVVLHKFSASSEAFSPLKALHVERNRVWLAFKNLPMLLLLGSFPATIRRYLWQSYGALAGRGASGAFAQSRGRVELLGLLLRAWYQAFLGLPRVLAQRRSILGNRTAPKAQVAQWFRTYGISAREIGLME